MFLNHPIERPKTFEEAEEFLKTYDSPKNCEIHKPREFGICYDDNDNVGRFDRIEC